jgi:cytochrome c oxidase subunit 1
MISYWLFFISSVIILISSLFVEAGPASSGWTIYPFSVHSGYSWFWYGYDFMVDFYGYLHLLFNGSLNYIVTVINLRTKGMSMTRLP